MRKLLCLLFCVGLLMMSLPVAATEGECRHVFSGWEDTGEAHSGICTLCGETVTAAHDYEEFWTVDAQSHTHRCSFCGHAEEGQTHQWDAWSGDEGGHVRLCTVCQAAGQSEGHSLSRPVVVRSALLFRDGRQEQTCTVCGYLQVTRLPAHKTLGIVLVSVAGAALVASGVLLILRHMKKKKAKKTA